MSVGIKCDVCGHINPMGRLFCATCGAKLDVKRITADSTTRARRRLRLLRVGISLALLAALIQMLRASPMDGHPGTLADANRLVARMNRLHNAVQERLFAQETIHESELNAYLAGLLVGPPETVTNEILRESLNAIRIRLAPGSVTVVWATRIGALPLTYSVSGTPRAGSSGFQFDLARVHVGRLPLPGPAGQWAATRLYATFAKLKSERNLLNALAALEVSERKAVVTVGRRD